MLVLILFLGGAAALGYEAMWSDALARIVGGDALAGAASIAGFFAGMAIGAAWIHPRLVRPQLRPLAWLARLELAAAVFALVSPWIFEALAELLAAATPARIAGIGQSLPLTLVAAALLLPGTFCLGATFPLAMEAERRRRPDALARGAGRLYFAHTFGATLGVLLTPFVLVAQLGHHGAAAVLAALGASAAALAGRGASGSGGPRSAAEGEASSSSASAESPPPPPDGGWLLLTATVTGSLGLGLEYLGFRVFGQVFSGTVYTFALILAVHLVFTSVGAAIYARVAPREGDTATHARWLSGLAFAIGTLIALSAIPVASLGAGFDPDADATSFAARCLEELSMAAAAFALPSLVMGGLYAHIMGRLGHAGTGRAVALNEIGAALAPFGVGWVLMPRLGLTESWFALAMGYFILAATWAWLARVRERSLGLLALGAIVALGVGHRSLELVQLPEGWEIEAQRVTPQGVVTLARGPELRPTAPGTAPRRLRRLQVDGLYRMGGSYAVAERRLGAVAGFFAPKGSRILVLGVGTGATAGGTLLHEPSAVTAVELVPEVLEFVPAFADVNEGIAVDPRATLVAADARHFVAASDERWPLIVGDLFHPERDGAGRLFTREHYEAVAAHLEPSGVYVQWLPMHQLDRESFASVARAFTEAFEHGELWLGLYNAQTPAMALVGSGSALPPFSLEALVERSAEPRMSGLSLADPYELVAGYITDADGLRAWLESEAPAVPTNSDAMPWLTYHAPRSRTRRAVGADNIEAMLRIKVPIPPARLAADWSADARQRLDAYGLAVEAYLRAEVARVRGAAFTEVDGHLFDAYAQTWSFRPAQLALLRRAEAEAAAGRPEAAAALLSRMRSEHPDDPRVAALAPPPTPP